tara:strand:+ start:4694 stop:5605 length:912 start_codon:yes stop_codon:yes gene_type:complete
MQLNFFKQQKNKKLFLDNQLMSFNLGKKKLNVVNKLVKNLFELNEDKKFKDLKDVQKFLNKTKYYKLEKNLNIMTRLESFILECFKNKKLLNKNIIGMEFPINVRIVHPSSPSQIKTRYSTSSIHCDPWAGEPDDMINVIINLAINNKTSEIKILKTSNNEAQFYKKLANTYKNKNFLNSKKYFNIIDQLEKKNTYDLKNIPGQVFIFGGYLPHHTYRRGDQVRIGLEFRLRTQSPFHSTKNWNNRLNRSGRYWHLPKKRILNFEDKLKFEYSNIDKYIKKKLFKKLRNQEVLKNLKYPIKFQ